MPLFRPPRFGVSQPSRTVVDAQHGLNDALLIRRKRACRDANVVSIRCRGRYRLGQVLSVIPDEFLRDWLPAHRAQLLGIIDHGQSPRIFAPRDAPPVTAPMMLDPLSSCPAR